MMSDIFGAALLDYYYDNYTEDIITESTISEADEMPLPYLFRSYNEMPKLEQKALQLCRGKVLDLGSGSGSHALYLQNEKFLNVTAVDISEGATKVAKLRGVKQALNLNFTDVKSKFDTIILLMNGVGLCGKLSRINLFLQHLKGLLNSSGQILLDSSDIAYMFDKDEDGGFWVDPNVYYGEVEFTMSYKGKITEPFDWLYLDFNTLAQSCIANGLKCELVLEGDHHDFLARLSHI